MKYSDNIQKISRRILVVVWIMTGLFFGFSENLRSEEQREDNGRADRNLVAVLNDITGKPAKESIPEKPFSWGRLNIGQGDILTVPVVLNQQAEVKGINITVNYNSNVLKAAGATLAGGILADRGYEMLLDNCASDEFKITVPAVKNNVSGSGKVILLFFEAVGRGPSALSLKSFNCNKADADGGFSVRDDIYDSILVVAN